MKDVRHPRDILDRQRLIEAVGDPRTGDELGVVDARGAQEDSDRVSRDEPDHGEEHDGRAEQDQERAPGPAQYIASQTTPSALPSPRGRGNKSATTSAAREGGRARRGP